MGAGASAECVAAANGLACAVKVASEDELKAALSALGDAEAIKIINVLSARGPRSLADITAAPPDPILTLAQWFKEDKNPNKCNLGVGAYRTEEGKPWPLPSVLAAQLAVVQDPTEDKEYVPIDGKPEHKMPVQQLLFSDAEIAKGTIATAQTLSGTGSLALIGQFLSDVLKCKVIHVSNPTWGNHNAIFKRAGVEVKQYTYYKPETRGFDFEGMIASLSAIPSGEAVLLHACAHNPTGVDPTDDQWNTIAQVCKSRKLIPILDNAYQGYASGSLEKDGASMRIFESSGLEYLVAQSFAKNFGLYGERIGYIHVRCETKDLATAVLSQVKILIRQAYSSPPRHGAAIVHKLLSTPELKSQWLGELKFMSERILQMRAQLRAALEARSTPGTWNHITDQIGMFSFTGLTTGQVERMVNEFSIYMTKDGRISVAGLNPGNVNYVAECIDKTVRGSSQLNLSYDNGNSKLGVSR
jgi:aspartate aminotransferase